MYKKLHFIDAIQQYKLRYCIWSHEMSIAVETIWRPTKLILSRDIRVGIKWIIERYLIRRPNARDVFADPDYKYRWTGINSFGTISRWFLFTRSPLSRSQHYFAKKTNICVILRGVARVTFAIFQQQELKVAAEMFAENVPHTRAMRYRVIHSWKSAWESRNR